jgi:hypothetical protein
MEMGTLVGLIIDGNGERKYLALPPQPLYWRGYFISIEWRGEGDPPYELIMEAEAYGWYYHPDVRKFYLRLEEE